MVAGSPIDQLDQLCNWWNNVDCYKLSRRKKQKQNNDHDDEWKDEKKAKIGLL